MTARSEIVEIPAALGQTGNFSVDTDIEDIVGEESVYLRSTMKISNTSGAYLYGHLYLETSPSSPAGAGDQRIGVGNVVNTNDWGINGNGGDTSGKPVNYSSGTDVVIDTPTTMVLKLNQITGAWSFWLNPDLSQPEPAEPTLSGINPRIIDGIGYIRFRGGRYGNIPVNTNLTDFTDVALFTGDDSPFNVPATRSDPVITSITAIGGGLYQLALLGVADTGYEFRSSTVLEFDPGTRVENLAPGDPAVGTIGGDNDSVLTTDSNGDATVRMMLAGPANFVRAQIPPPPPPLFSEDFEADNGGFTMVDHSAGGTGTDWVHGDPDSSGEGGSVTTGNGGSTNCWGTDIGNPGIYATGTDTSLISPVIDLTGVPDAVLSFAQAIDILNGDTLVVNVLDDTTDTVIEAAVHTSTPDADINAADWETVDSVSITGGEPVRIEWRFTGTNDGTYIGAYLDDVVVSVK